MLALMKTLWRRFAMSVECQAVSASLKPVQVRVLGLEGGFQYDGDGDGARGLFVGARELGVLGGEEGPALEVSPGEGQDQGVRCDCGEAGTSGWSVGLGEAKYTHDSVLLGRAAEGLSSVRAALAGRGDVVNDADVDEKDYEEKGEGRALEVDVSAIGLTLRRLDSPLGCWRRGFALRWTSLTVAFAQILLWAFGGAAPRWASTFRSAYSTSASKPTISPSAPPIGGSPVTGS